MRQMTRHGMRTVGASRDPFRPIISRKDYNSPLLKLWLERNELEVVMWRQFRSGAYAGKSEARVRAVIARVARSANRRKAKWERENIQREVE